MELFGYRSQGCRRALCIAGYVLSCGLLRLVFYWKPAWHVWANCTHCSLGEADVTLLRTTDEFQIYSRKTVTWVSVSAVNNFTSDCPVTADERSLVNRAIMKPELKVRSIEVQKIRYVWNQSEQQFQRAGCLEDGHTCSDIHAKFGSGLSQEERDIRRLVCGPNTIDVPVVPVWKLLVREVLNPFYVFQLFSVCLWFAEDYKEYALAIIVMSLLSIAVTVYDLRQQSRKLHKLVESHNSVRVTVCSLCALVPLPEQPHAPGGTLQRRHGCASGQGAVPHSPPGESIPVTKTPLPRSGDARPWRTCCAEDYKRHVLFCGTEIVQSQADGSGPARAVVLRTGFNTAKGGLVRSILYPKPMDFKLYRDAIRFLTCLVLLAMVGMVYAVCVFALSGEAVGEVVKKALDVITIAVPPALPAALATGVMYTQGRLKKKGIFCISPQRINVCGQLNLVCFDKTGTLTEDGLDLWGVIPSEANSFQNVHRFAAGHSLSWGPVCGAMASCHSLLLLDGKIQGDPLDLKMFEATNWVKEPREGLVSEGQFAHALVIKPGPNAGHVPVEGIAVLRQFPFSSALQRMSVLAQEIGGEQRVFMKGAPETVAKFCRPETGPSQQQPSRIVFSLLLATATHMSRRGLRRVYLQQGTQSAGSPREELESDLTFLGLLIMENRLKAETKPVLEELSAARIRSVMVTGDNVQTAITVAKNSGMISPTSKVILVEANERSGSPAASISWQLTEASSPNGHGNLETRIPVGGRGRAEVERRSYHFAMSGRSYQVITQHFGYLLPKLLLQGTVFARMSPGQKSSLVEEFQKLGYFVGMCGDGANDCGRAKRRPCALCLGDRAARRSRPPPSNRHLLSPFRRQGRAALVTSFCVFKYMALYSTIQYLGVLLLYWQLNSFGNYQFLFQDLAITTVIGITMSLNGAYPKLVPYRPPSQLISPPLLLSVVLNILFSLAMQVFGFVMVQQQPWYAQHNIHSACHPRNNSQVENSSLAPALGANGGERGKKSYENTTVWLLSTMNCLLVALVFSKGKPFRQPVYTNYLFVLVLAVQLGVCVFLVFADIDGLYSHMDLVCTPTSWRASLLLMLLVTFAVSFVVE
uniref:Cation-transporting ATPase n=1 Tax=Pelodiscus sinensis TaxID=13735 RepID=K7G2Q9_PELSI